LAVAAPLALFVIIGGIIAFLGDTNDR
jgi:hypothetical protein